MSEAIGLVGTLLLPPPPHFDTQTVHVDTCSCQKASWNVLCSFLLPQPFLCCALFSSVTFSSRCKANKVWIVQQITAFTFFIWQQCQLFMEVIYMTNHKWADDSRGQVCGSIAIVTIERLVAWTTKCIEFRLCVCLWLMLSQRGIVLQKKTIAKQCWTNHAFKSSYSI